MSTLKPIFQRNIFHRTAAGSWVEQPALAHTWCEPMASFWFVVIATAITYITKATNNTSGRTGLAQNLVNSVVPSRAMKYTIYALWCSAKHSFISRIELWGRSRCTPLTMLSMIVAAIAAMIAPKRTLIHRNVRGWGSDADSAMNTANNSDILLPSINGEADYCCLGLCFGHKMYMESPPNAISAASSRTPLVTLGFAAAVIAIVAPTPIRGRIPEATLCLTRAMCSFSEEGLYLEIPNGICFSRAGASAVAGMCFLSLELWLVRTLSPTYRGCNKERTGSLFLWLRWFDSSHGSFGWMEGVN
jgi:hypothetical protein